MESKMMINLSKRKRRCNNLIILLSASVLFLIFNIPFELHAGLAYRISANNNITGTIIEIVRDSVTIKDENSIDKFRFYAPREWLESFKIGERVRVYYSLPGWTLISIKRMTVMPCQEGQNLGYVSGCPAEGKENR
jgi:hypothetical protein